MGLKRTEHRIGLRVNTRCSQPSKRLPARKDFTEVSDSQPRKMAIVGSVDISSPLVPSRVDDRIAPGDRVLICSASPVGIFTAEPILSIRVARIRCSVSIVNSHKGAQLSMEPSYAKRPSYFEPSLRVIYENCKLIRDSGDKCEKVGNPSCLST